MTEPVDPSPEPFMLPPDFDMEAFEARLDPESKQLVDEMRVDALKASPEDREVIENEVGHFLGEMALGEWVQTQADAHIQRAKELAGAPSAKETEDESIQKPQSTTLDGIKIGWIPGDSGITISLDKKGDEERPYLFGSMVDMHRVTNNAFQHLVEEGEAEHLMEALMGSAIPRFLEDLRSGGGRLRPISIGNRPPRDVKPDRSLNTHYPAYKLDVLGTNNRAIVILPDKIDGVQAVVLVAMYDHEDQDKIGSALFLKWVSNK